MKLFKSLLPISILAITGCSPTLPKCDAKETKQLLIQLFKQHLGNQHFSITDIVEKDFNKEIESRVCTATANINTKSEKFNYRVYWGNKKTSYFLVEIIK